MAILRYKHHNDQPVAVQSHLAGKHRAHCLCFKCSCFDPGTIYNCPIADAVYNSCKEHNIVTPVWECPNFVEVRP